MGDPTSELPTPPNELPKPISLNPLSHEVEPPEQPLIKPNLVSKDDELNVCREKFEELSIGELKQAIDLNVAEIKQKITPRNSDMEYLALVGLLKDKYLKTLGSLSLVELQQMRKQKKEELEASKSSKYSMAEELMYDALGQKITQIIDARQTTKCYKVYQNFSPEQIRTLLDELDELTEQTTAIDGELINKRVQREVLGNLYQRKMSESPNELN